MATTQTLDALEQARGVRDAGVQEEREAREDLEWCRKYKATKGRIREAEERHAAATGAVAEATKRVEKLEQAAAAIDGLRDRYAGIRERIRQGDDRLVEVLLALARVYGEIQTDQLEALSVNNEYGNHCSTLGLHGQDLGGWNVSEFVQLNQQFWSFAPDFLVRVRNAKRNGTPVADLVHRVEVEVAANR